MTHADVVIIGLCVLILVLPPRFDPAIRIKEWLMRR